MKNVTDCFRYFDMSEDSQQEILNRHNISWLYHITHIENLFSIFDSGLHPHELEICSLTLLRSCSPCCDGMRFRCGR